MFYLNFRFKIALYFVKTEGERLMRGFVMLRNIALVVVCCLLVACSSTDRKLPVQSDSFFVHGLEQSKVRNEICGTCRFLGWNAKLEADNKILASITKGDIELSIVISFKDDGICVIDPVKISCSPSDKRRARQLFRRYIRNLRKHIRKNTAEVTR